jgi:hypothetical protein
MPSQEDVNTDALMELAKTGALSGSGEESAAVNMPFVNPYKDPEYMRLRAEAEEKARQGIEQQRGGVQDVENLLKDYMAQPQQIDLSALMGLADTWTGSNMAGSYKRPVSAEERKLKAAELQDILRKGAAGVTEKELEILRAQMGEKKSEAELLSQYAQRKAQMELAQQKAKQKGAFAGLNPKQATDLKLKWFKEVGTPMNDLAQVAGNALAAKRIIEAEGGRPLPGSPLYEKYQKAVAALITAYNKDYAKLGALTGADLTLLERATGVKTSNMGADVAQNLFFDQDGNKTAAVLGDIASAVDRIVSDSEGTTRTVFGEEIVPIYREVKSQYEGKKQGLSGEEKKPISEAVDLEKLSDEQLQALYNKKMGAK